jgi:hypothetical protein
LDRDELSVVLEVRGARFVFNHITQVDHELGPDLVIHSRYEGLAKLARVRRELAQLALKVGSWAEMLVGDQGETHAGQRSALLSGGGVQSSVCDQDFDLSTQELHS